MLSSRNSAEFDGKELSDIRDDLKNIIEKEKLFDNNLFEVWINEEEPNQSYEEDVWEKCLKEARQADIVIVLYNGEAGYLRPKDSLGICHAEVLEATNVARGKVWNVSLNNCFSMNVTEKQKIANTNFKKFIDEQKLYDKPVDTYIELEQSIKKILHNAVKELVLKGVHEVSRNKGNYGETLLWKRMNYETRSEMILKSLCEAIDVKEIGFKKDNHYYIKQNSQNILLILHAIPDSYSIGKARERVGQPFLEDFKSSEFLTSDKKVIGPIHVIGCNKTVTETQVRNTLGFPDVTILKSSFGIYVADNIQKIQMIFIEKCSDSHSTRHGFQGFLNWAETTGEIDELISRAQSRKKIISAIADEN